MNLASHFSQMISDIMLAPLVGEILYFFFFAAFANGDFAFPALISAHLRRAASAIALRPAALSRRLASLGAAGLGVVAVTIGFLPGPGGLPRRLAGPCSASIARDSRSRSAMSKATIWSVCMNEGNIVGRFGSTNGVCSLVGGNKVAGML
jgi:hypothetical protein